MIPRIYVACLAAYNNGRLHGCWIDCNQESEEIREAIQEMLKKSPEPMAEEYAIHDHEGWGGLSLSEGENIEKLAELAGLIDEHGEAYIAYTEHVGTDYATLEDFEDAYNGEWDSPEEFAEDLFRQCHEIPDFLDYYIDWESVARDLFINDYSCERTDTGTIHVFRVI